MITMQQKQKYIKPCIEVIRGASPGMLLAGSTRANGEDWKRDDDEDLSGSEIEESAWGANAKKYSMDSLNWKTVW